MVREKIVASHDSQPHSRRKEVAEANVERRGNSPPSRHLYSYRTYGLRIGSQLELPELPESLPCAQPDVVIEAGEVEDSLDGATFRNNWLEMGDDRCQINIKGIARYQVTNGQKILIDRRVSRDEQAVAAPGDIRLFLLGGALGALLHQRQWLPLHISALKTTSGVWAFTGDSGAGKSTLGVWLHHTLGWPLVTDDVAIIKPDENLPYLHPGPPRVKLWKDALAALGIQMDGLVRDLTRADKYHLMLKEGFQDTAHPLTALVILERGKEGETAILERIKGVEAFKGIMSSLYRPEMAEAFNSNKRLMQDVASLSAQIYVYRFRRPWALEGFERGLAPLLTEIEACSRGRALA